MLLDEVVLQTPAYFNKSKNKEENLVSVMEKISTKAPLTQIQRLINEKVLEKKKIYLIEVTGLA